MAKMGTQKIFAAFLFLVGVVLLCMYALLQAKGGKPSSGMLVVGVVDLLVGFVLFRRAKSAGGA